MTSKPLPKLLSKTKLMRGFQCLKSIYLTIHNKELEPPVTPELQAIFDQGNQVGEEARKLYPEGILIDKPAWDFFGSLKETRALLAKETPVIFEAAFEYRGCYARADMIRYSPESKRWTLTEVKSTLKVKEEHLLDVGLQAWIMANSGLPLEKICILHLNPECRYPNLSNLFVEVDVTEELRARHRSIAPKLNEIFAGLRQEQQPDVDIGPHCKIPNECPFWDHCASEHKVPRISIFNLPKLEEKKWELYAEGILSLEDPALSDSKLLSLTDLQKRIISVHRSKARYIDRTEIQKAISDWKFPMVFLDFETINPAIPRYTGTGPYQQVPFQFSAHRWESPDHEPIQSEYFHAETSDPRPELIQKLLDSCREAGSIVAYYSKFEMSRITELADFSPVHQKELLGLLPKFVDPLPVIRDHVYDTGFEGSFSLKKVAPALLGASASYSGMAIEDGAAAQRAYLEVLSPETTMERKKELIRSSLEYCRKDTLLLVELVQWLMKEGQ